MADALLLDGIEKTYDQVRAVDTLHLAVPQGSVYGLLGPNGAGKTTTIRMILDIIRPDAGRILVFGEDDPEMRRKRISYLPEERGLYRKMKVRELVLYIARLRGMDSAEARKRSDYWFQRFDLTAFADAKLEALSKGMGQKVQFIATILHRPDVLILDEPFSGLDPVNVELVKEVMQEVHREGATILFSTHQMDTVERLCDAICLINHGKKVLEGSVGDVRRKHGTNSIQIEYEGVAKFLADRSLIASVDDTGRYAELTPAPGVETQRILEAAVREVRVRRFEVMEPSLHRIFVDTVRGMSAGA